MEITTISDFKLKLLEGIQNKTLPEYVYSYPPKRAFRKFEKPLLASDIWNKDVKELNLYIHIPFCTSRCSFCTLFACTNYSESYLESYVSQICRQISFYGQHLPNAVIRTIYFGGGTPSLLSKSALSKIFASIKNSFKAMAADIEITIEGTPESYTAEKLDDLSTIGINRISVGIQSFSEKELRLTGRCTKPEDLKQTISNIAKRFNKFNLDLIYGLAGQTRTSWFDSINQALAYKPSILSLYPVVLRPQASMTNLCNKEDQAFLSNQEKYDIYDETVNMLASKNYKQHSFTRFSLSEESSYLQETLDFQGMPLLGIGVGARSYNGKFHYDWGYSPSVKKAHDMIDVFLSTVYDEGHKITSIMS